MFTILLTTWVPINEPVKCWLDSQMYVEMLVQTFYREIKGLGGADSSWIRSRYMPVTLSCFVPRSLNSLFVPRTSTVLVCTAYNHHWCSLWILWWAKRANKPGLTGLWSMQVAASCHYRTIFKVSMPGWIKSRKRTESINNDACLLLRCDIDYSNCCFKWFVK